MDKLTLQLKHGTLTRVGYLDAPIPAQFVGLTEEVVRGVNWAEPLWADAGQVKFGAATWIVDIGDTRIALDPIMAADAILRATPEAEAEQQRAIAASLEAAGYPLTSVDVVLLTHFDGVGAIGHVAEDRAWSPFFPNARIMISQVLMDDFIQSPPAEPDPEYDAFAELIRQGHFDTFADKQEVFPGITTDVSGAHGTGHTVFHLAENDNDQGIAFIGHLAISPLHLVTGPNEAFHDDALTAFDLLHKAAASGRTLVGPLWPAPGYGQWNGEQLSPPQ